jgi:hypothetical protein
VKLRPGEVSSLCLSSLERILVVSQRPGERPEAAFLNLADGKFAESADIIALDLAFACRHFTLAFGDDASFYFRSLA